MNRGSNAANGSSSKTTLFSMCIGEQNVDNGKIYLNNKSIEQVPIHLRSKEGLGYLPQPFGPSIPTHSPGKTFKFNFFSIGRPSKDLLTSLTSNIGLSFLNFNILKPFFILN